MCPRLRSFFSLPFHELSFGGGRRSTLLCIGDKISAGSIAGLNLATPPINKRGVTKLIPDLPRFCTLAQSGRPVLCIADVDRGCAVQLIRRWLPHGKPARMLLRLAVTEAESWLLADQEGLQRLIDVPQHKIPQAPETLVDAKQQLLALINRYGSKTPPGDGDQRGNPSHLPEQATISIWNNLSRSTGSRNVRQSVPLVCDGPLSA